MSHKSTTDTPKSPASEGRRVKDLTPRAKEADGVRGGALRKGGDDDLDDLEVER